jgi:hypothetical protein
MKTNLLIGAISGNYSIADVDNWITTSKFENVERLLILYNDNNELERYIKDHDITIIKPSFDNWGLEKHGYSTNTGTMTLDTSYDLIHNIRFFHIWRYLQTVEHENVIITDVRDVYFNENPFNSLDPIKLTATSEMILYNDEEWNRQHVYTNLGLIGVDLLLDKPVYNVGVWGGPHELVKQLCADIYLLSVGRHKVADQTSFNYLIQTKYKEQTNFTTLDDKFAVHLHVINAGIVPFDLNTVSQYKIVHQYDRIAGFKR